MKNIVKQICLLAILILEATNLVFSQAVNKPSIMVFPDDIWMNSNGYLKEVDNQGVKTTVLDYKQALLNEELGQVITKIEKIMLDRGYPLENLSQTLKSIQDAEAIKNMETSEDGSNVQVSLKDKLLNTARPDLILYVSWKVNTLGPKKSVYFSMKALDAGTNKPAGAADGTGNELIGAPLGLMLETAVLSHIDNFNAQLMTYFDEMVTKKKEMYKPTSSTVRIPFSLKSDHFCVISL